MSYDATGRIIEVFDEQVISEKFRKREFVLEVQDGQYPEQIKFQTVNDKNSLVDPFPVGSEVKVAFNLRGRGYSKEGKMLYFTNLEAWRIEPVGAGAPQGGGNYGGGQQQQAAPRPVQNQNPGLQQSKPAPIASDDDNDLPF